MTSSLQMPSSFDLLITNVDVLSFAKGEITRLAAQDIAIAQGRILRIAPVIEPGGAREVIDGTGLTATPGMVNCHSHVAMSLLRGVAEDVSVQDWFNSFVWPMETGLTPEDVHAGSLLGIAEMIACGVTTFADHYFMTAEVARAAEVSGMRAVLAPTVFSGEGEEADLAAAAGFVETWQGGAGGRITTMMGPHAPYTCTPDFLAKVAKRARELGVGAHIHLSETAEQVELCRRETGKTPVALIEGLGFGEVHTLAAHLGHPAGDDLEILARSGMSVASTPKTEMKLAVGVTPVVAMREAGIAVGLGSDGAASNNGHDILDAARLVALLEKNTRRDPSVLPLGEALGLASADGAAALGLGDVTGQIREGFAADIVLRRIGAGVHDAPVHDAAASLLYSAQPSDVHSVMIDGRMVYRAGVHLTIDVPGLIEDAGARAARLADGAYDSLMAFYRA